MRFLDKEGIASVYGLFVIFVYFNFRLTYMNVKFRIIVSLALSSTSLLRSISLGVLPNIPENGAVFDNGRTASAEKVTKMLGQVREENPRTIDQIRRFIVNWRTSVGALASVFCYGACVAPARNQGLNGPQAFVAGGHIF